MRGKPHEPIEAVIFDLGRVLIDFDFDRAFRAAAPFVGLSAAEIRARLFGKSDFAGFDRGRDVVAFECGRISGPEFHRRVEALLNFNMPYEAFCELWNCIFIAEIPETVALARKLQAKNGLKVGVLTNTNVLHFEHLRRRWSLLEEFRHVYASHEIGCRKPEAESYRHVLKAMNVPASRAVLVDDLADNVAGAKAVGMMTVHATHAEAVRSGLAAMGLV